MKQALLPAIATIALLAAGCAREPYKEQIRPEETDGVLVSISASIADEDGSKALVQDDGNFTWASGDQIGVWTSNDQFTRFSLKSGDEGKSRAEFTATLPTGVTVVGPAVYPYRANHAYNSGSSQLTYYQGNADDWNPHVTKSHMAAVIDPSGDFHFKHLDGLLRITVYNIPANAARARITSSDNTIFGNFVVDMSADEPAITTAPGGSRNFDMKLNDYNTGEVGNGFVFNYPLPVGSYANLIFALLDKDYNPIDGCSRTIPSVNITRKKMVKMPSLVFDAVLLADSEEGTLRNNIMKNDTGASYANTEGTSLTVVDNPWVSINNASGKVLKLDAHGQTAPAYKGGYFPMTTKNADYTNGFRTGTKAFTIAVHYASESDATLYYPRAWCKDGKVARMVTTEATLPDRVNGQPFDGSAERWSKLIKPGDWNVLQWTVDNTATWRVDVTPFLSLAGTPVTDGSRVIYLDDFRYLTYANPVNPDPHVTQSPVDVQSKAVSGDAWTTYQAYTVDCIDGFDPRDPDPVTNKYGGWTARNFGNPDGYFRTRKIGNRWWFIDPLGNPYLSAGVAAFTPGNSDRQKENIATHYDGKNSNWAKAEIPFLFENRFNSVGAWSESILIKDWLSDSERIPYTIILSPMSSYIGELRHSTDPTLVAAFADNGWEDYPYDFPMVFDSRFEDHIQSELNKASKKVSEFVNEKHLIGYFLDNEMPLKNYALEWCLTKWPEEHINHIKAQEWLDTRKGKTGATLSEATDADKKAFIAYCYGVYLEKVITALRAVDPNHLILGSRFNQWDQELNNQALFEVAGQYLDVISINHYRKWEPDVDIMNNWASWAGKPFLITEFYTKGVDTGMANTTGAGWIVPTQEDRGLFYQNFVNQLLKSNACVGWHWFSYMDNDPTNTEADASNIDSNKGIVQWNCTHYDDCVSQMQTINKCLFNLATFYN